jgi:putative membrane protein
MSSHIPYLFGTIAFVIPAIIAFFITKPMVQGLGGAITWNRSALLALACMVFGVIATLLSIGSPMLDIYLPLFYAVSLGFVFGIRLLVLAAVADYRPSRVIVPALVQSGTGLILSTAGLLVTPFFDPLFFWVALVSHVVFGGGTVMLIWLVERPLYRAFHIHGLDFLNTFIAHLTDGDKRMEDFFRTIGEEVWVPQVSFFFRRATGKGMLLTIPNVHPGPMGDVGGGNLPRILHASFPEEVMVAHGCATHDFNLVSETEIQKIITALRASAETLSFTPAASRSLRLSQGSVQFLCQRFGPSLLMVATRAPEKTEDLDYSIGSTIMAEGHRYYPHLGFIDAHNSMTDVESAVLPATRVATEYVRGAEKGMEACNSVPLHPFRAGISRVTFPYSREQGFGDIGVQALVIETDSQKTAYVLLDGNNLVRGLREELRAPLLGIVDDCEIMTTDSHVVNTITGKNPIGQKVPAADIVPYVERAVREAVADASACDVAASTACCRKVVIFGSHRVTQLAATVNTIMVFIAPLSLAILLLAFLLTIIAFIVIH